MATESRSAARARTRLDLALIAACAVVLLLLVTRAQKAFLPGGLATQVGHNSEVFMLALALVGSLVFIRPWRVQWGPSWLGPPLLAGLLMIGAAAAAYFLVTRTTVRTLNEPLLAAGLLCLYVALPRPLRPSRSAAWWISGALVLFCVLAWDTAFVRTQAESLTALIVAPIAFDVIDRSILENRQAPPGGRVFVWTALLVLWPVAALLTGDLRDGEGLTAAFLDYQARGAEGFWAIALVQIHFVLRRNLVARPSETPMAADA